MRFETLFFDLDDTLYSSTSGIWEAIGNRMVQYMVTKLEIPEVTAPVERERLFHTHGTTMRGLVAEYHIEEVDFLEYVHDISIEQFLSPNFALRNMLESYPQRKVIFTNADTGHAIRVLESLGVKDLFEQIIDIRSITPWCKPQPEAFAKALSLASIKNPKNCVMIDDALRNLVTAHDMGLFTIQVGVQEVIQPVDAAILSIEELPKVLSKNN
ncbi:MAG: pyrimidine 5'-nucleotidase [Chloroflexi bacterium HGW-Chloroflexi-5]|jgi:putative hydrolase of the HAD superfamily|nr:MAG: pyrimidine 5'-nucleotidase [Chloroflexi bacterium HGW-Chloroflexi-5]